MVKTLNPRIRATDVMPDVLGTAQIAAGGVGTSELADSAVVSGKIGSAAVISGYLASGQVGALHIYDAAVTSGKVISGGIGTAHLYARGGLASGAENSGFTFAHNFGATPSRENIFLTPRANAVFWVTDANNSAVIISTSVSGTGCDVKVLA